jgi:hypothetical protein
MTMVRSMDAALRASLEDLLRRLPVRDDRRDEIAMETAGLYFAARMASVNELPRTKRAGGNIARRELAKLAKLANAFGKHIKNNMHLDALEAIDAQPGRRPTIDIVDDMRNLLIAIEGAEKIIPNSPPSEPYGYKKIVKLYRGDLHGKKLHAKHQARDTTKYAAYVFEKLTGKKVKRTPQMVRSNAHLYAKEDGEFCQFLTDVFKLLRIDAKAAGQIKLLLAEKGREKTPS